MLDSAGFHFISYGLDVLFASLRQHPLDFGKFTEHTPCKIFIFGSL